MANTRGADTTFYVTAEQLQIGLFVFVDLPWFQHPFTLNSFRISSEDQIRTLRTLGEARFRYDPERSDAVLETVTSEAVPVESLPVAAEGADESWREDDPLIVAQQERTRVLN